MHTRREVLRGGLGFMGLGAVGPYLGTAMGSTSEAPIARAGAETTPRALRGMPEALKASRPLAPRSFDPKPRYIDGFRFKSWFEGDDFTGSQFPFHKEEGVFPNGNPPAPQEEIDLAIIGGGISGLTSAYLLQEHNPVVFELHDRFGGNAQGGEINGAKYSLGSAYIITPDKGSSLDIIYTDLGFYDVIRVDEIPAPAEINGKLNDNIWAGLGVPKEDIPAYEAYQALVLEYADNYPDVPFPEQWMIDLDQISLRQHIEQEVGMPIPAPLAAAIQAYCYASFGGGWEEISATLGWNFLAAEEFGRWILPGGNAWIAEKMWERIAVLDQSDPAHAPHLRASKKVVDLRVQPDGRSLITWENTDGSFHSLLAKQVVMACPKNIARKIIHNLEQDEPERYNAMRLTRRAYLVGTIVLDRPVPHDFYDIFLLNDPETFPMSQNEAEHFWQYTDVTNGSYTPDPYSPALPVGSKILSLYWPLAFENARFSLILDDPILQYGQAMATKLRTTLKLLDMPESAVQEIRFARWGHALPLARVGFLTDGIPALIMAPYRENVHFVNQDDWALPAIENAMLDAIEVADVIRANLNG